jgi:vancomycin resistance protein VanJ
VRVLGGSALSLAIAWALGQLVRDGSYLGQVAFYVPTPLVAVILLATAALARARGWRRLSAATGLASLLPLAFVLAVEQRWMPRAAAAEPAGGGLRVVHWNVRRGRDWARARPIAIAARADLYAFSEPPYGGRADEVGRALGYGSALPLGELSLVARGRLGAPRWLSWSPLQAVLVPWTVDGVTLRLLLVDFVSDLRVARGPHLLHLRALIDAHRPDLVLGDLNAPRRSRSLHPPPPGFVHAYEAAGRGWSATWPVPVPLWSIDHCLVGPRLGVTRYRLRGNRGSDHRMQVVDLAPRYHGGTL